MSRRSQVPIGSILKSAWNVASNRSFAKSLVAFQTEKQFFNVLYPNRSDGYANRIRQCSFRITDMCNLRCHTCGQWGDNGYLLGNSLKELRQREIPKERYIELLRDMKAHGHQPVLYFWGGEPMLYKGLLDVIEEGARLGMPPTIATNGTRVAKEADRITDAPMAIVQISVDGPTAEIHNAARPGAAKSHDNFSDVVAAFEKLRELREKKNKKLPLVVSLSVVSRENYTRLVDLYDRFKDVTDLQIFYLSWWIDMDSAKAHADDYEGRFGERPRLPFGWVGEWSQFDYDALSVELKKLKRRASGWGNTPVYLMPDLVEPEDLHRYYTDHDARFGFNECISIFQVPEIDSNGNLSPCRDYHDYVVGNVNENTITELWNSERYVKFRRSINRDGLMPVCTRCCGLMGY